MKLDPFLDIQVNIMFIILYIVCRAYYRMLELNLFKLIP